MTFGALVLCLAPLHGCADDAGETSDAGGRTDVEATDQDAPDADGIDASSTPDGGGPEEPFPCGTVGPVAVGPPSKLPLGRFPRLLAADDGWVAAWIREQVLSVPEPAGLFVARVGGAPKRLVPDIYATGLVGSRTDDGFLLCWESSCASVDSSLALRAVTDVPEGRVVALPRLASDLHAVTERELAPPLLFPIDSSGTRAGPSVELPCVPVAWNDDRLVCLEPSDPFCRDPYAEPSVCRWVLRLLTPDGSLVADGIDVAPFGAYLDTTEAHVAARDDGLLVGWRDESGIHTLSVTLAGDLGARQDFATRTTWEFTLSAAPPGYVALFSDIERTNTSYTLPRLAVLDPSGALLQDATAISPVAGPPDQNGSVVGSSGEGWAALWNAEVCCNQRFESTLMLRSFGCAGPPYETPARPDAGPSDGGDPTPVPNDPYPDAVFQEYGWDAGRPGIVISLGNGSGNGECELCSGPDQVYIGITEPLPLTAPTVIEWDANAGIFGPDFVRDTEGAISGRIEITWYEPAQRLAGRYEAMLGLDTQVSGSFDAVFCDAVTHVPCL